MNKIDSCIRTILTALLVTLLCGCFMDRPDVDLSKISVGMDKTEVINALGKPDRIAVDGSVEYLEYEAYDNSGWDWKGKRNFRWSFVKLINDQVKSYGQKGDFNSTKDPTLDLNIHMKTDN